MSRAAQQLHPDVERDRDSCNMLASRGQHIAVVTNNGRDTVDWV